VRVLRFLTAGESHGPALSVILEGLPAGLEIDTAALQAFMQRRKEGYGRGARMAIEDDAVRILGGVRHGRTIGSPIAMQIENRDHEKWREAMSPEPVSAEAEIRAVTRPRPGHADLAGALKYNTHDVRDVLERASARETAARVAAGGIAVQFLARFDIQIASHVVALGGIGLPAGEEVPFVDIASLAPLSPLRVTDDALAARMVEAIDAAAKDGDTLGGVFEVVAAGVLPGLGSHRHWDTRLDGRLAQAILSIPALKAVEIGQGTASAGARGSAVHDEILRTGRWQGFTRRTNRAGGIEGGISNGGEIRVRGHMKPLSTLRRPLASVDVTTGEAVQAVVERSDVTAVPAAGVVGEAMVALVLADALLEKFGGDSVAETERNLRGYRTQIQKF